MNKNIKILLNYLVGPVLFCWLFWSMYQQVSLQKDIALQIKEWKGIFTFKGFTLLVAVFVFMLLHWWMEAVKWKLLMGETHAMGMKASLKSVFSGVAVSLATPYRMGEFAGRIIHLPDGTRLKGSVLTFVGSFAQLIITLMAGTVALILQQDEVRSILASHGLQQAVDVMLVVAPVVTVICLFLFFGAGIQLIHAIRMPWFQKAYRHFRVLETMSHQKLISVLVISAGRFFIFILQYWILFHLFEVFLHWRDVFLQISIMFLWLAFVPLFAWIDLGLRWQFSLLLLGHLSTNALGISFAVTAVWFFNLIIPGIIGAFTLLGLASRRT